jgi:hypothetical protein
MSTRTKDRIISAAIASVVAILVVSGVVIALLADARQTNIEVCGRGNLTRFGELHQREHLVMVNRRRVQAGEPGPDRRANRYALAKYRSDLLEHIQAQEAVALEPGPTPGHLAKTPESSVEVPCETIFPPLPLGLG